MARYHPGTLQFEDLESDTSETNHVWLGGQNDAPTDAEIGSGNVAVYARNDNNLYMRPYGGTEQEVGAGAGENYEAAVPLASELSDGGALAMGVPLPDGKTLDIISWGVRTSANTTPSGLTIQLTEPDDSIITEENTAYSEPSASATNTSGAVKWYRFRISNTTGTNYTDPDYVLGNVIYDIT